MDVITSSSSFVIKTPSTAIVIRKYTVYVLTPVQSLTDRLLRLAPSGHWLLQTHETIHRELTLLHYRLAYVYHRHSHRNWGQSIGPIKMQIRSKEKDLK